MRILFIGDVVGATGLRLLADQLSRLIDKHQVDFTIANVENAADGLGVTPEIAQEALGLGVNCMTTGNHVWDKKEIREYIAQEPRLLRPANYPADLPGKGSYVGQSPAGVRIGVVNVMGRIFMPPSNDPFRAARSAVEGIRRQTPIIVVDMHAEATSEKIAMGWHLDGQASAVLGTHTHVPTADETILPGGTAFITDVGMTGPHDSVIGMEKEAALARFLDQPSSRRGQTKGDPRLNAVLVQVERTTGRASSITRLAVPGSFGIKEPR